MSPRCSIPLEHRNIASSATPRYSPDECCAVPAISAVSDDDLIGKTAEAFEPDDGAEAFDLKQGFQRRLLGLRAFEAAESGRVSKSHRMASACARCIARTKDAGTTCSDRVEVRAKPTKLGPEASLTVR
jgi:hypothetical protein